MKSASSNWKSIFNASISLTNTRIITESYCHDSYKGLLEAGGPTEGVGPPNLSIVFGKENISNNPGITGEFMGGCEVTLMLVCVFLQ